MKANRYFVYCLAGILSGLFIPVTFATNGMNMIGLDAISASMGGAESAVDTGVASLSSNPANLSSIEKSELIIDLGILSPAMNFKNSTYWGSNDIDSETQYFPLPFLGYASRVKETPFVWGIGLFAQGGMGVDFRDVVTDFGTHDKIYSNVAYGKIVPAISYDVSDALSLGVALQIGYSTMAYDFFPGTTYYSPGADQTPQTADDIVFPGQSMENAASFGYGARVGLNWHIDDMTAFGISYTTEAKLDYDEGDLTMNFGALGLGKVRYNAEVDGFTWPASVDMGFSRKFLDERFLLAADITWYNWSDAIKTVTIKGSKPNDVNAPPNVEIPFIFNWDDEWIFSLGAAYKISEFDTLRLGYNYGNNPVPDDNMYPLFPAIVEHHAAIGYGHRFSDNLKIDVTWEHAFKATEMNMNSDPNHNPFGPESEVSHDQNTLHMMLTYSF
ncbi:outer membrane protein transport protein [bacterium]|nr:outer membrane protein transport protein [candidate division CSSED10-310 bacterium]